LTWGPLQYTIALSLISLELGLRILPLNNLIKVDTVDQKHWVLKPSSTIITHNKKATINKKGFRRNPYSPSINIENHQKYGKIIFVGDSFTFGDGVSDENTFPSLFDKHLKKNKYNYDVINAGVSDYSPYNYLRMIQDNIVHIDDVKLIVVSFYAGNDFIDRPKEKLTGFFRNNFRSVALLLFLIDRWMKDDYDPVIDRLRSVENISGFTERSKRNIVKSYEYGLKIKKILDGKNIPVVFVYIPLATQLDKNANEYFAFYRQQTGRESSDLPAATSADWLLNEPANIFKSYCVLNDMKCLDLSPYFLNSGLPIIMLPGENYSIKKEIYSYDTGHLSEAGSMLVGKIISSFIQSQELLSSAHNK
jgi:hypothetical protein